MRFCRILELVSLFFHKNFLHLILLGRKRIIVSFGMDESEEVYLLSLAIMLANFGNLGMTTRL